jgi:predicted AlkP superfamily pyrophosphatase or phosphodiesterase
LGLALILAGATPALAAPPPRPKLVVAISVDQFSLELYQRYRPSFTGGLKRLGEGLSFTGYQSHAATETCPGHSTILTGFHPAKTGIVANSWYERKSGSTVYCVSVSGTADPNARGSGMLKVDALGDWLKTARPGSRSFAVSGKDRAAIMMAGHHPNAVYWWNDTEGFATSSYAGPATKKTVGAARSFNQALYAKWKKTPPQLWPTEIPGICKPLEQPHTFGRLALSGTIPPESSKDAEQPSDYIKSTHFADELRASPSFDPLALDFASQLVTANRLGRGPATDLLAVSLSSTDHVGHRYGNGGAESCVQVMAVDAALGGFFDRLDRLGVPYVVVLTADHGAIDAAERLGPPARRIDTNQLTGALSRHLRDAFGMAYDPLAGDDARQLIFNLAPDDDKKRDAILADALAWLKARPEVGAAFTAAEIARSAPPAGKPVQDLTLAERFYESYDAERSGDILVAYAEGSTLGAPAAPGETVAGHGSVWDYDRRVPILFWWPGVQPTAEAQPMETVDIAPTLAAVVGIEAPPVDGRCVDIGQGCGR